MLVHHPDKDFQGIERVGGAVVRFEKGRATVTRPYLLGHYRRNRYAVTEDNARRPATANRAAPVSEAAPAPAAVERSVEHDPDTED